MLLPHLRLEKFAKQNQKEERVVALLITIIEKH